MKIQVSVSFILAFFFLFSCVGPNNDNDNKNIETPLNPDPDTFNFVLDSINSGLMEVMKAMLDKMNKVDITGDYDMVFAKMMIIHHQAAIDMAQIEVLKGTDAEMKSMAKNIISKQTAEMKKLEDIIKKHKTGGGSHGAHEELQTSRKSMMARMKEIEMTNSTDKNFVLMMIPHHESAIYMAVQQANNGHHVHLKLLAKDMIADQRNEIAKFKEWLTKN